MMVLTARAILTYATTSNLNGLCAYSARTPRIGLNLFMFPRTAAGAKAARVRAMRRVIALKIDEGNEYGDKYMRDLLVCDVSINLTDDDTLRPHPLLRLRLLHLCHGGQGRRCCCEVIAT
eukprot:5541436-Pleurochrysis_carterae.AAC.1